MRETFLRSVCENYSSLNLTADCENVESSECSGSAGTGLSLGAACGACGDSSVHAGEL